MTCTVTCAGRAICLPDIYAIQKTYRKYSIRKVYRQYEKADFNGEISPYSHSIKILKLGQHAMVKRKIYTFRNGEMKEYQEYHDGNYGAKGKKRAKKKKLTKEQMQKVNADNKTRRCRHKMLEYIDYGDCFGTWTYAIENRPLDMQGALRDFQKAIRKVRNEYQKRGYELYWFRNIERGTKGAWHIHFVINEIGDTASIMQRAWDKGGTYTVKIRNDPKLYSEDFSKLAAYMTKDEHTCEEKKDGTAAKPRLKETSYNTSRNMPLKEPCVKKLVYWRKEVKPEKGYYIISIHESKNPFTGNKCRTYIMARIPEKIKINRRI